MTRNPVNAFFRNGQPVPLTTSDLAARYGSDEADVRKAIAYLRRCGFVSQSKKHKIVLFELSPAGIDFARQQLCIKPISKEAA